MPEYNTAPTSVELVTAAAPSTGNQIWASQI
jgi:hypothetical protein